MRNYWVENYDITIKIYSLTSSEEQTPFFDFDNRIQIIHCGLNVPSAKLSDRIKLNLEIRSLLGKIKDAFIITCVCDISIAVLLNKSKAKNCKVIVTEHNEYDAATNKRHKLEKFIYSRADKLVILTKSDQLKYEKYLSNVVHIPNAISFKSKLYTNYNNGRLEKVKGFDRLIEAFSLISDKHPEWKLDIYGVGLEDKRLKCLIKEKCLSKKVSIKGNEPDIKSKMLDGSIHVVTSFHEGFSLVVIEAMECALLNIYMETTGTCSTIKNGENGILVKQGDIEELSQKMDYYMSNTKELRKIAQRAKKDAKKYYIDNISSMWMNTFHEINKNIFNSEEDK